MNTKIIPSINTLVAKMPSGRNIHAIPKYAPPDLDPGVLEDMHAMPEGDDDFAGGISSDDETKSPPPPLVAGTHPPDEVGSAAGSTAASSHRYY